MSLRAQSWLKLHFILSILAQISGYLLNLGQKIQRSLNLGTKLTLYSHSWLKKMLNCSFSDKEHIPPLTLGANSKAMRSIKDKNIGFDLNLGSNSMVFSQSRRVFYYSSLNH